MYVQKVYDDYSMKKLLGYNVCAIKVPNKTSVCLIYSLTRFLKFALGKTKKNLSSFFSVPASKELFRAS